MDGAKILISRFSCVRVYSSSPVSSASQICPRIASQKSLQKCVCSPPSSRSTSTTTASSASQKPSSICKCWPILTSGGSLLRLYFQFEEYISVLRFALRRCLFPISEHKQGMKCSHEREAFPLLLKFNSQCPDTHCSMLLCAVYNVGHCFLFIPSRNLLSVLPKYLFSLPLKVLLVSNNKLVSIPEEIGRSKELMELVSGVYVCRCIWTRADPVASVIPFPTLCLPLQDVSCNEIQALPAQVGRLQGLRELNIRKNCLHTLPEGQSITTHRVAEFLWNTPSLFEVDTFGGNTGPLTAKNHTSTVLFYVGCHVDISSAQTARWQICAQFLLCEV